MHLFFRSVRFEYKITLLYVLLGGFWILFSDKLLLTFVHDLNLVSELQTYKGWFYVLITALFLFSFLKSHLNKLRDTEHKLIVHQETMQETIREKTERLNIAIQNLSDKNKLIVAQNDKLKRTLNDLKQTQNQLVQVEKMASLGQLAAGLSHEINNPLNFILLGIKGIQSSIASLDGSHHKCDLYIRSVHEGIDRISKVVKLFNELFNRKKDFVEVNSISEIIEASINELELESLRRVVLHKKYTSDTYSLDCNARQLQYVFVNLLKNAIDAIPGEGKIELFTRVENKSLLISVKDNGVGISPAHITRLADPFFTTKSPGDGVGLGLSIVLNIINNHEGTIDIESKEKEGTKVKILLPINNK